MARAAPTARACWRRAATGSLTVMSVTPRASRTARMSQADRPTAGDQDAVLGSPRRPARRRGWRWPSARPGPPPGWSASPGSAGRWPRTTVTYRAKAPRMSRMSDGPRRRQTEGRPRRHGRHTAAPRGRVEHHPLAPRPRRPDPFGRGHDARPLVTEDGPRLDVPVEDQVEVGSADPTLGHLHEQLARPWVGYGHFLDGDPAVPHADSRRHQTTWHGGHATARVGHRLRTAPDPRWSGPGAEVNGRSGPDPTRSGRKSQPHRTATITTPDR